ncbi:MAG TPA: thioredoxin family protein [Vicinamibacterales bacterium]|nr:thioredoxin family protein [Vicinamibacterales bacterium]
MSLISDSDRARLTSDFAAMTRPVTLLFFSQTIGCETCLQTRQVIDELPPLSSRITIEEANLVLDRDRAARYGIDRAPSLALLGQDEHGHEIDSHIRFVGTPSGYEFISLIRAILLVGGGASMLSPGSREKLAAIDTPMSMFVFSTPTCPHCPKAVTLAHEIAWANPNVTAYAVEATENPDLSRQYRVTGVPKTVINGQVEILGAVPEDTFIEQTLAGFAGGRVDDAP